MLFFLLTIANFGFFMWEYKSGAFATPVSETSAPNTSSQEQILLVRELKTAVSSGQQTQKPATDEQAPVLTDKTEGN